MVLSAALRGLPVDLRRDAVGGEDHGRALRHLVELLDEDRAARLEVGHDVLVVDDLLADVDRGAVQVERLLDGHHRAVDAGAVAAGRGQQHGALGLVRATGRRGCPGRCVMAPESTDGAVRRRRSSAARRRVAAVALETTPEAPAPVRQIANAIAGWIDRLGAVWVEGQIAQVSRRPGISTVFLTLRDPVADVSVPVTCSRTLFDGARPAAGRGRQRRRARQAVATTPTAAPSRCTPARSGWSASASCSPGSSAAASCWPPRGCSPPSRKRPLPFLPGCVGLVTAPRLGRRARRPGERPAPLAGGRVRGRRTPRCRARAPPPRSSRRSSRLDRDPDVDVIVIARGGGSVEDLLPFSDEGLVRAVHRARTPVVSAIGHEPDTPLLDLVADVRASTPTDAAKLVVPDVAEELRRVDGRPRPAARRARPAGWPASRPGSTRCASRPALADPRSLLDARADEVAAAARPGPPHLGHALDRAADDLGHQRARARALSPLATLQRGYAVLQDADGHVVTSVAGVAAGADGQRPRRRRPHPRHHDRGRARPADRRTAETSRGAPMADEKPVLRGRPRGAGRGGPPARGRAAPPSRSRWRSGSAASSSRPSARTGSTAPASGSTRPWRPTTEAATGSTSAVGGGERRGQACAGPPRRPSRRPAASSAAARWRRRGRRRSRRRTATSADRAVDRDRLALGRRPRRRRSQQLSSGGVLLPDAGEPPVLGQHPDAPRGRRPAIDVDRRGDPARGQRGG